MDECSATTQRRGHEDWMIVPNLLIDICLAKYFIVHGRKITCRFTEKKKKTLRCLHGGLEVPWTNEFAMKGKVAPAKRFEKTWCSVVSSTRKRNCSFQGKQMS